MAKQDIPIESRCTLASKIDELNRLAELIHQHGTQAGWSERTIFDISLVCEEIFVNIVHYGYPSGEDQDQTILLTIHSNSQVIELRIEDSGVPFNPIEQHDPDTSLSLEDRQVGGLGIYLVKKIMDEAAYERVGSMMNRILLKKSIEQ